MSQPEEKTEKQYVNSHVEICEKCNLPKVVVTYELGFRMLQEQMIQLRKDLLAALDRIDAFDRRVSSGTEDGSS